MTITSSDRERVKTDISPFGAQDKLQDDLPNVLKNMLREMASRDQVPNGIELSERTIRDLCGQNDMGSYTLEIDNRLTAELSEYPFEASYNTGLGMADLQEKIQSPQYSYPAVELALTEYDPLEYEIQPDKNGKARHLRVLVMAVNHNDVLVYDPLRFAEVEAEGGLKATEVDKSSFISAWEGRLETTSSLWIEETDQQRLSGY